MESPQDVVAPELEQAVGLHVEETREEPQLPSQKEVMEEVKKMLADALNYKGFYAQRYYPRIQMMVNGVTLDQESLSFVEGALQQIDEVVRPVMGPNWKEKYAQQISR